MNPLFIPNDQEEQLIETIQKYCREEFCLIRMTETMLKKSIIDASGEMRDILRNGQVVDFTNMPQGEEGRKYYDTDIIAQSKVAEQKTSYYRPNTKKGDPRFWPSRLPRYAHENDLIYFTVYEGKVVAIPLRDDPEFENTLKSYFGEPETIEDYVGMLTEMMRDIKGKWIESVSPDKSNPRDVGDTLEKALGIPVNNLKNADFMGEVEIKAKRANAKTKDTLFSKVPNWKISPVSSAVDMMLTYGYESAKHPGYRDLYVTVGNTPNAQGLFLKSLPEETMLAQKAIQGQEEKDTCYWEYETLKNTLHEKHPTTIWVVGEEKRINGKIHFQYNKVQLTKQPIFSQFISLIDQGIITFDWRGKVKPDRTKYRDHGHAFRLKSPKDRKKLFGSVEDLEL
ncbi:MvaI/BcnI family restriction endonuclease [Algivirga pacifica]|uniref:MvaI/BcnI restriction endonuclease domain-containing protein n=1 Tax=Algivirga pacifica TaxID=1162670 RepID=A0ABP9DP97_9BACT